MSVLFVTRDFQMSAGNLVLSKMAQSVSSYKDVSPRVFSHKDGPIGDIYDDLSIEVTVGPFKRFLTTLRSSTRLAVCNLMPEDKLVKEIAQRGIPHCCIESSSDSDPKISFASMQSPLQYVTVTLPEVRTDGDATFSLPKLLERIEATNFPSTQIATIDAQLAKATRPLCAVFSHSLERNGANNFLLFLTMNLLTSQNFVVYSPKMGPMKEDFEKLGMTVHILDPNADDFADALEKQLLAEDVGMCLCNTIMRADVVTLADKIGLPSVWVIHEAWPQSEFEYYAKEVFMMKHIDEHLMKNAFGLASRVVFPSVVQKNIYNGLYDPKDAMTVYNGIPLHDMDKFIRNNDRDQVRASMGYKPEDFVVLHLGTICFRKGQIHTARAFSKLVSEKGAKNAKLLYVGARYIRDHEIKYIADIKTELENHNLTWARHEDTAVEDRGKAQVAIMDIQSGCNPFYMIADVVLVPSLNEVLPLVIGEAMSFKKPVIASKIAAIPEAMDNGVEGLFVEPGDSDMLCQNIHKLYQSEELRKSLGERGRERVLRQFSFDVMGRQYREIIDNVHEEEKVEQRKALTKNFSYCSLVSLASLCDEEAEQAVAEREASDENYPSSEDTSYPRSDSSDLEDSNDVSDV